MRPPSFEQETLRSAASAKSSWLNCRRLIINADDFGGSHAINQAVVRAHQEGVLTTTSLMVNGEAADEAIDLARQNPDLGVGLHLTLICGRASLPATRIPGLVNTNGLFREDPVRTGWRYFFHRELKPQLQSEIQAQFEKFHRSGLVLDHVNGHLNLHLHPTVLSILLRPARAWRLSALRLTRDPFWLNARLARGQWIYRSSHAFIFWILSLRARKLLRNHDVRHTRLVFGLLQNGRVDEEFLLRLIKQLPPGDSELYSHPSLEEPKPEFDALLSSRVRELIQAQHIQLIRYQDL